MVTLVLAAGTTVAVAFLLVRARFWPLGPCSWCRGRGGRGWGSTKKAYSRCHSCGGTGRRIRPLARIYPRWRKEARKGK